MSTDDHANATGAIAWMARNGVAANLLMFVILAAGLVGLLRTKQEVFPTFTLDIVTVSVPYPGASPVEVEQGIVLAIEEEVGGLDGVKKVNSSSAEGMGTVSVELLLGADLQVALADIKSAVDGIQSFPEDALEPRVNLASPRPEVVSLVISGDHDLATLHGIAERVRTDLTTAPGVKLPRLGEGALQTVAELLLPDALLYYDAPTITQVDIAGARDLEVSIDISRETLDQYGLTLDGVARQIRAQSLELPGGAVKTEGGEILLRLDERRDTAIGFSDIILRSTTAGGIVRLGDVATITDGYADTDQAAYYQGERAVRVTAYRVGSETPRGVSAILRAYKKRLRTELPESVTLATWNDDSVLLDERIALLVKNGLSGLVLVFIVLALLLDMRLAFWVGLGIPISFMGTFFLMPVADVSINMVSLFAFIITLGLVVDDAIIVGENIYEYTQQGMDMMDAAVRGASEMAVPVAFSILTTCAAFAPMLLVPGVMGKIFRVMPVIVIIVLFFSLVESFFVLPAHLGHQPAAFTFIGKVLAPFLRPIDWVRIRVSGLLDQFTSKIYRPSLRLALGFRYITAAAALGSFIVSIGVVASGVVPFQFFPKLEGDLIVATAKFPYGTPVEQTRAVQLRLEESFARAVEKSGGDSIVRGVFSRLGETKPAGGPGGGAVEIGSHLTAVEVNLVPTDYRDISAQELGYLWEEELGEVPGIESLVFKSNVGPDAGAAVEVQLLHADDEVLAAASAELKNLLGTFPSLTNIQNSYSSGKDQLAFQLTDQAAALGLSSSSIGTEVRSSFFGAEALRQQRGRNELKVMVRLPEGQRGSEFDLEELEISTPSGGRVPLAYVANTERTQAPTVIARERGRRMVSVKAELAKGFVDSQPVKEALEAEILPKIRADFPGVTTQYAGAQREQSETMAALLQNFVLSAFVIYALLAIPFRSYTQPFLIMSAIPMGMVGAIGGHMLMQYELSMISMFGVIALAGVVVNDSLVLVDATNQRRAAGASAEDAVVEGGARRLRPILLTSLTTFMGLAPMILETSVQARFLIPMAISLGFGVLFTTVVTLVLVPALYLILEDILSLVSRAGGAVIAEPPGEPAH